MRNFDFDYFLSSIRHLSREDALETARLEQKELDKIKSASKRREVMDFAKKIKAFLVSDGQAPIGKIKRIE